MKKYLCVDVGGTAIKMGILDEEGTIYETKKVKVPPTIEEMYQVIVDAFFHEDNLEGVALSMPGAVDSEKGINWWF